jgi:hypothetical protein
MGGGTLQFKGNNNIGYWMSGEEFGGTLQFKII